MGNVDPAAGDLLSAASALLQTDEKSAVEMAQRAFAIGITSSAPSFLAQLATKDPAASDQLYAFALQRMANDPASTPGQALLLAAYPFGENQVWVTTGPMTMSMSFSPVKGYTTSPTLIQQFLAASIAVLGRTAALDPAQSPDATSRMASGLFAAKMLQPKFATFQPGLMDELSDLTSKMTSATSDQTKQQIDQSTQSAAQAANANNSSGGNNTNANTNNSGSGSGNGNSFGASIGMPRDTGDQVRKLLDQAENATDSDSKDSLYAQAALAADQGGDIDRAFDISGKISDRDYRAQAKSWVSYDAASHAMKDKHFDDARRFASQVDDVEQYVTLFTQIATEALQEKDQPRATELLNDAAHRVNAAADSQGKVRALLSIASVYSGFDQMRGFEVISDAVQAANKVREYDPDQGSAINTRTLGNNKSTTMRMITSSDGLDISRTLGVLAKSDFDRSLLLAQSLENKTLRITSTIAIASAAFDKKKP